MIDAVLAALVRYGDRELTMEDIMKDLCAVCGAPERDELRVFTHHLFQNIDPDYDHMLHIAVDYLRTCQLQIVGLEILEIKCV